ncbi:MAG: TerB family tellurite resistance protein [Candidatus Eremiobacterota bacterium]
MMNNDMKQEIFNVGRALIAMAQADGEISRGEMGLIENVIMGLDEEDDKYTVKMKEALSEKQNLKDIIPLIKSNPGKALLLYQICLLVFADNRVDPKELEEIDNVFALIDLDIKFKEKAMNFVKAGQELVINLQENMS